MIVIYHIVSAVFAFLMISLLLVICLYLIYSFFCEVAGAPFVPTTRRNAREILDKAKLKRGQVFIELGSGDGRITRLAAKKYHVKATGVELNLLLAVFSMILARLQGLPNANFRKQNLFKADLRSADVIFMFLLTRTVQKLQPKLLAECKNNALVISHGFQIPGLKQYLVLVIKRPVFSTYYYRLRRAS